MIVFYKISYIKFKFKYKIYIATKTMIFCHSCMNWWSNMQDGVSLLAFFPFSYCIDTFYKFTEMLCWIISLFFYNFINFFRWFHIKFIKGIFCFIHSFGYNIKLIFLIYFVGFWHLCWGILSNFDHREGDYFHCCCYKIQYPIFLTFSICEDIIFYWI